ncbi:hypothetical protein D3C84_949990 [compost metagenome]
MTPASRWRVTLARRSRVSTLPGSTATAKRRLLRVYSWVQNTCVSPGRAARRDNELYICLGVPSNRRPQPAAKRVSPQNSRPG